MPKLVPDIKKRPPAFMSLMVAIVAYVVLFGMISMSVAPERYDLRVGEVAKTTITASKDVEDTVTTEQMRSEAERAVKPSYNSDDTVMPTVMEAMEAAMAEVDVLPQLRNGMDGAVLDTATPAMISQARTQLRAIGADTENHPMTDEEIRVLVESDELELETLTEDVLTRVRETLNGRLIEGQEDEAIAGFRRELVGAEFSADMVDAVLRVTRTLLRPNMLLDAETTEQNRNKARDDVQPVIYKKGQNIVRNGEVITALQIAMLDSLGMLKDRAVDITLYMGIGLMLLLLAMVIGVYLYTFEPEIIKDPSKLVLLCVICIIVVGFSMMVRPVSSYLMPVVLGAILTTLLLKSRLAIITNLVLSVLTGLLASADSGMFTSTMFSVILTSFISGTVSVVIIRSRRQRLSVLMAGMAASVVSALCTVAVALINSVDLQNTLNWAGYAAGSGVLSAVLAIGLQPALEWIFNLDTGPKLLDLANPNQELIRRLMIEAPGTYHHSMIVANMSEAAANAIGANGLLARVGSYYHDIGKLKRPLYFKENQMNDNPHDRTDPRVSTAILTSHTRDGVEMAQKARLPHAIREIILQHHGDTPVLYFYDKAVKQGGDVNIEDFRYDGPRPEKQEAAIVMLADTIEAAARAMTDSTPEKLTNLIQRLVRSKMDDGQLDRCSLTFHDLNLICEAFLTVLGGVFHERIEYPTVEIPERKRLDDSALDLPVADAPKEPVVLPPEAEPAPDPILSTAAETFLEALPTEDETQQEEDES